MGLNSYMFGCDPYASYVKLELNSYMFGCDPYAPMLQMDAPPRMDAPLKMAQNKNTNHSQISFFLAV